MTRLTSPPGPEAGSTGFRTGGWRRRTTALVAILALGAGLSVGGVGAAYAADASTGGAVEYTVAEGVTFDVPAEVTVGEPIRISGAGWQNLAGDAGSVIGVKLDEGAVSTRAEITNPVTGIVQGNKTIYGIVQADATGAWQLELPWPTLENATVAWQAGETHSVRLLTGSLLTGDALRSATASFTTADASVPEPTPSVTPAPSVTPTPAPTATPTPSEPAADEAPQWAHETVTYTDTASGRTATAWVEKNIAAGDDSTIRIKGTGWVNQAGIGASTVALKLNRGDGQQYTRTGGAVVQHPSASGDTTIWTLLAPANPQQNPSVVTIDADGDFEIEIDAPDGLAAGQYLSVLFQSGRFDSADVQRTVTTDFLTVGGVPYEGGGTDDQVTCVPTSAQPTVTIENPSVALGGTLHLTGTGWCHPGENRGGSVIAIKFDEGAFSRLAADVHQNLTIWTLVTAAAADGTFDVEIALPDGTTAGGTGSSPAFTDGVHTLRLLTGSLTPGDEVRTLRSAEFVVGAYQPNGAPDPVDAATLTTANRNGVTVARSGGSLVATVPSAREGDWLFVTPFAPDGSPRYPWLGTWSQADASGRIALSLSGVTLPTGTLKVAVQSGNQGELGTLIGWGTLTIAAPANPVAPVAPTPTAAPAAETAAVTTRPSHTLAKRTAAQTAPTTVPAAPFADSAGLVTGNAGGVTSAHEGTVVTLTLPGTTPGDWVYLYAYSTPIAIGWIQTDDSNQVRVDIAALLAGEHKLAALDLDGNLLGWTGVTVAAEEAEAAVTTDADEPADAAVEPTPIAEADDDSTATTGLSVADWWLIAGGIVLVLAALIVTLVVRARRARAHDAEALL